jgi:hypothetical protein
MARSQRSDTILSARAATRKAEARRRDREAREIEWCAPPQAAAVPVDLTDRATSATGAKGHDIPADWWTVIDREWCHRMMGEARRWQGRADEAVRAGARAARLNDRWRIEVRRHEEATGQAEEGRPAPADEIGPSARAKYARARARTIALERSAVLETCGKRSLVKRCACGPRSAKIGCGQVLLCDKCRRPYYKRIRRRTLAAVNARVADGVQAWRDGGKQKGERPAIVLVTLTIPRVDNGRPMPLSERRERVIEGWKRLRTWLHKKIGKFPYVMLPELTSGEDGGGHLHYHAICIWPWWDWHEARAEWRRATGLSHANPPDMRPVKDPRTAAHYVAKYASKGTNVGSAGMTPQLIAEFVATYYGKRRIIPSQGFWIPQPPPACPCCGEAIVVEERPVPVVEAMAAWRARAGIAGVGDEATDPIWIKRRDWLQVAPRW